MSLTAAFRSDGAVRICVQLDEAKVNLTIFSSEGVNLLTFSELFKEKINLTLFSNTMENKICLLEKQDDTRLYVLLPEK